MPIPRMKKKMQFVCISDRFLDTIIFPSPPAVANNPGIEIRAPIISVDEMPFSFRTNGSFVGIERNRTKRVNVAI